MSRPGLESARERARKAREEDDIGATHDISNQVFDYDTLKEARFVKSRGIKLEPGSPPAYPYSCKPECETCFTQYFPVRINLTDAEALSGIQVLTNSIHEDLDFLRQALDHHADLIVTRWRKKSKAKRADFLSRFHTQGTMWKPLQHNAGVPGLYDKKWAAVHLINDHSDDIGKARNPSQSSKGSKSTLDSMSDFLSPYLDRFMERASLEDQAVRYRTTWLLPYLDTQSLAEEPLLLLSLLHYRTAHTPEDWMMFDNSQLKLGENWEVLISEFNRHCVNMNGSGYGVELVEWDKDRCHRWDAVGYQKAQHILTAQQELMNFLKLVVEGLIGGLESSTGTNDAIARTPAPKFDQLVQNQFFSFGNSPAYAIRDFVNQPFSAPPHFDPLKTFELVETMYRESVDELELAQTDPAYLQCLVRELGASAYFERIDSASRWDWYMDELVCNFYRRFIWWRQMLKECQMMVEAYEKWKESLSVKTRAEYELALFVIHDVSLEHLAQQILLVEHSLPFQRGFERNYDWGQETHPDGTKRPTINDKDAFETDKMFWSLKCLGFDEYRLFTMDPSFHFRVLDDHLSRANFKERNRISAQLLRNVSEMAVVDEIRTAIACDRGWNRQPYRESLKGPQFRKDFIDKYQKKLCLPEIIDKGKVPRHLRTLCKEHPWPKGKMDHQWLEQASASRRHLGQLWTSFRIGLKAQQQSEGFSQAFIDEDFAALSAANRPPYTSAIEEERRVVIEKISQRSLMAVQKHTRQNVPELTAWSGNQPDKYVLPTMREKKKTRPSTTDSENNSTSPEASTSPQQKSLPQVVKSPSPTRSIVVKPENLSLFDAMFSKYATQSRSFSWKHLLQAMVDAGCSVTQGSGSAVSFKNDCGVIVFHQPHPEPTIDPVMLMSMGKRLNKWFGWNEDTFAEVTSC